MAGSSLGLNRSRQGNNCIKSAANRLGIEQERGLSVFDIYTINPHKDI